MITKILRTAGHAGLVSGAVLLVALTGCNKSQPEIRYVNAPAAPGPTAVMVQDDYVYYPAYEVYFSSYRHQYVYRDGSAWVSRPAPPRISVDVLLASPSVRMDFRDAPERHHESIIRTYPKNWSPSDRGRGDRNERKDERKEKR